MDRVDEAARDRINRALSVCACERNSGIVFPCPGTLLPDIGDKLMIRGPCEHVNLPPRPFECPRHVIMCR